jgi:hypothetical protein
MYAAIWHRGRQSLGVARFYQRGIGGPVSRIHECLFRGAIYLPMIAATLAYTHLAPVEYEGQAYFALAAGRDIAAVVGSAAALSVISYLAWAWWPNREVTSQPVCDGNAESTSIQTSPNGEGLQAARKNPTRFTAKEIHPGEWWIVLAHAVSFGSSYVFGAVNASFLLVLAVHHEVQYLYFTYAMARREPGFFSDSTSKAASSYLFWPVAGFTGAMIGGRLNSQWIGPLGVGGLFCHYWLDSRIWRRRSLNL